MTWTDIQTDDRARATLPGAAKNAHYVVEQYEDGSMLLLPARLVSEAQHEYDSTPELRALLSRAAASPTVTRPRRQRRSS